MAWFWPFKRNGAGSDTVSEKLLGTPTVPPERRSAMSGFTAELMSARESYISGRRGIAELTATAQSCISLWEAGFAIADVKGTRFLDRCLMGMIARALALRGEFVGLIGNAGIVPCSDWDLRTRNGRPTAYRVSISEAGGGTTQTALAAEVLHVRVGADVAAPWSGQAPLRRASLTAGMLQAVESAIAEVYEMAPIGSQVVPMPEQAETDSTALARSFRGQRGRVLLRESVAVSAAGGPVPATDWKPQDLTPNLQNAMTTETLAAARDAIAACFGVLPSLFTSAAQGPQTRECQRHLATWCLQPLAELLAEEASEKLAAKIEIDVLTPTQSFDQGGSARAVTALVQAAVMAKEAGISDAALAGIFAKMDWTE